MLMQTLYTQEILVLTQPSLSMAIMLPQITVI